jgi:hypothetical protein
MPWDEDAIRKLDALTAEQASEEIRVAADRLRKSLFELLQQIRTPAGRPDIDPEPDPSARFRPAQYRRHTFD